MEANTENFTMYRSFQSQLPFVLPGLPATFPNPKCKALKLIIYFECQTNRLLSEYDDGGCCKVAISFRQFATGLIHISEISNDFVKDVSKVAKIDDILYAKVLDVDHKLKHVKCKAIQTLRKNIGESLQDLGLEKEFSDLRTKA